MDEIIQHVISRFKSDFFHIMIISVPLILFLKLIFKGTSNSKIKEIRKNNKVKTLYERLSTSSNMKTIHNSKESLVYLIQDKDYLGLSYIDIIEIGNDRIFEITKRLYEEKKNSKRSSIGLITDLNTSISLLDERDIYFDNKRALLNAIKKDLEENTEKLRTTVST